MCAANINSAAARDMWVPYCWRGTFVTNLGVPGRHLVRCLPVTKSLPSHLLLAEPFQSWQHWRKNWNVLQVVGDMVAMA